jgi:NAD(P)-dependent dehydrogenase (short-subunit alcohol dehydrogenase family)
MVIEEIKEPSQKESSLKAGRPEIVVVTGASAGLGRAIVRAFAREGAHIGLLARGRDGLEGARRDVENLGGEALAIPVDVADAEGVEQAAETVERQYAITSSPQLWISQNRKWLAMAGAGLTGLTIGAFLKRALIRRA